MDVHPNCHPAWMSMSKAVESCYVESCCEAPSTDIKPYERFGSLGRGVFHGPRFQQMDMSLGKAFKLSERWKLDLRASAANVLNDPSFDCVQANLNSGNFGKAQCLAQSQNGLGAPTSRVMSLGLRLAF